MPTVLITGTSSGYGLAAVEHFLRQGWRVIATMRTPDPRLFRPSGQLRVLALDVTDEASIARAIDQGIEAFGGIDVLVNNAGISANKPSLEVTPEEWRRAVDINLTGVFLCAQAAGRRMVPKGEGCIINLASMYGVVAAPDRAAYCATKGAVVLLTETLAVEWGPAGVRVNALAPGYVETDLVRDLAARGRLDPEHLKQRTPLRRLAQPAEMADLAVFLASSQAAYITGHTLVADGGWSRYSYL